MKFRDYLYFEKITLKSFAESIELSPAHLSGYSRGKLRVSKKVARAIERATNGKVTAEEIMKNNPPKKKPGHK